ncbi:MAG: choice-of-anchor B family protein, partial [Chitinophagales bacterium]|nr:choice-of-anchor B family protein [Chitinophagales bacterium]
VNEEGGGMLIVDLAGLPGSVTTKFFTAGALNLQTGHSIQIDEFGICYVNGSNISVGGVLFFDLNADPMTPVYLGEYESNYVHDSNIRNNIMWTSEIYKGWFRAIDVSNKANPIQLAQQSTPGNFNHNSALSDNGSYVYTTDEVTNSYITSYNVSDLGNITELDRFQANPGTSSIGHNVHVKGNYLVIAYYRDGVIIADATHPDNLIKVGSYDTSPFAGSGYNGCWEAYPYLPSGNILAADIEQGLYVLGVTYTPACYLNGTVTDYSTGAVLSGVTVTITGGDGSSASTNLSGVYATGFSTAGSYSVTFSKSGYSTKTITHVSLTSGITTILNTTLKNTSLPQCVTPTGLSATNITSSSATLKWSDEYVSSFTLKLKNLSNNTVTTYTPYVNSLNVTGLSSCTSYKFRVKGKCTSTGQFTAFSSWYSFNASGSNCKYIYGDEYVLGNEVQQIIYPNPFNDVLNVVVNLNNDGAVMISLYDVTGRMVKEISAQQYAAGSNYITIDANDLGKGIYFCSIKTSDSVITKKIVKE